MMSPKALAALEFIEQFVAKNHYPPTLQEICNGMGYKSKNSVAVLLAELEECGTIQRTPRKARGIHLA
jgi:SOS-response transcriptional repressor LexA